MPAYREMSRRSRPGASPSTLLAVVHGERLPSLRAVPAFVTGCGGSAEELSRFTAAWQLTGSAYGYLTAWRSRVAGRGGGTCSSASLPVIDAGTSGFRSGRGGGNSTALAPGTQGLGIAPSLPGASPDESTWL